MSVKSHTRTVLVMAADLLAVFFGILAALALRLGVDGAKYQIEEQDGGTKIAFASFVWLVGMYFHDLYDYEVISGREEMLLRLIQSVGLSWVALSLIYSFVPSLALGPGTALYAIAITLFMLLIIRFFVQVWLGHPEIGEKILVVGNGRGVTDMVNAANARSAAGYRIVGFLSDNATNGSTHATGNGDASHFSTDEATNAASTNGNVLGVKNLGTFEDLEEVVSNSRIDRVVVSMAERRGALPTEALLRLRLGGNVTIDECLSFYERICGKVHLDMVRPSWLIFSQHSRNTQLKSFVRDFVHRLLALISLVLTLPLAVITAVIIKLESRGPVFYRQTRVGKGDRPFVLIKFRSMRVDAEENGKPVWAKVNDDRATLFGQFIRKVRIDEIPQFWNILKGEMRFVGPRPERPHFVEQLSDEIVLYKYRHLVAPGLTGWAQVNYPYGATVEDARHKLEYDLYYIKNQTLILDLLIVVQTIKIIVLGRGSR